jgi:DNA-binding MarR family transcriptional regulator
MTSEPRAANEFAPTALDVTARGLITLVGAAISITDAIARLPVDPILTGNAPVAIILSVWRSGPMRPVDLGEIVGMTSGGTTKVIDRLENAGLVTKTKEGGDADGRAVYVDLTDLGRSVTERLLSELTSIMRELTDDLDAIRSEGAR